MSQNANTNNNTMATFYFKLANTCQTKYYTFDTNINIDTFIAAVKCNAYNDFNIDRNLQIEIVEAAQEILNVRPEDAPALIPRSTLTLKDKYENNYNITFYIRISTF